MQKALVRLFIPVFILVGLCVTLTPSLVAFAKDAKPPADVVASAWKQAQLLGAYRFHSNVEQITYPAASLSNVGRAPSYAYLTASGESDLNADLVEMSLASGTTAEENAASKMEVRIDHGQGYVRQPNGEWLQRDDVSNLLFTKGDPLSLIQTIKNVKSATVTDKDLLVTFAYSSAVQHFTFDLDSEAFARYSKEQFEAGLRARGELPVGVQLQASDYLRQIAGSGDIWIDNDGLPVRLVMQLAFPPAKNGDQMAANIRSDFSGFDRKALTPFHSAAEQVALALHLPRTTRAWGDLAVGMIVFSIFGSGALLLVFFRHSRRLYVTVVVSVIVATVSTPLFQAQKLYAFSEKMEQLAETDDAEAAPDLMESQNHLEQLLAAARGQDVLATQSRLERASASALNGPALQNNNGGPDGDGDGLSDSYEAELGSDPSNPDSDSDTLNDGVEVLKLGTSALNSDSDNDGLSDAQESAGFAVNGRLWYTSPTDEDSDNDGMLDGADCVGQTGVVTPAVPCADTDSDGTPDLFEADNDNDGVPDSADLSPFTQRGQSAPYGKETPFHLRADGLNSNKPLYVNLQLRPKVGAHLSSAMNVLDWPAHDSQGNIRRYLDTTFANSSNVTIRNEDANAVNGDMRIIPMISVRIPKQVGSFGNLPPKANATPITASSTITDFFNAIDQSKLDAYGMSLLKADNNTLELLAPANLKTDPNGGARVAFNAHMLYQSSSSGAWGADHEVRLIWLVQMIIDLCNDPSQEGTAFCDNDANRHDELAVLHTYVDDFYVTGVTIEEQHGLDVAVLFENPINDPDTTADNRLWHIGFGLMNTFASGSDEDHNGQRDLTVAEIYRRWETSNASAADRWQVPTGATGVETLHYDHPDQIATVMMTETKRILDSYFMNGSTPRASAPTLLFARERAVRSAALDPTSTATAISFSSVPVETFADVSWAPYRYDNGWQNYPIADYVEQMRQRLNSDSYFVPVDNTTDSQIEAHTRLTLASGFYLQLYHGYSNMVQRDSVPMVNNSPVTNQDLATQPSSDFALSMYQLTRYTSAGLKGIYTVIKSTIALHTKGSSLKSTGGALLATGIIVASLLILYSEEGAESHSARIASATVSAIGVTAAAYTSIRMIQLYRAASTGVAASQAASKLGILVEKNKVGKVGLVIGVAVAWGTYAYSVLGDGKDPDDPQALATAVAMTVFVILMFIISAIPIVGAAVQLFLLIFDGLAMLICGITGDSGGICGGLSGLIIGALADLFYDTTMFVDMEDTNRLRIREVRPEIVDNTMGVIDGNSLRLTVAFTNALKPADDFYSPLGNGDLYREGDIRQSTFAHSLSLQEEKLDGKLDLGQMSGQWTADRNLQRYTRVTELSRIFPLGAYGVGVNVPYIAYLNEGYVVPYEECFTFLFFKSCKTHSIRGSNSFNIAEGITYDILPATFDEFAALQFDGTAYRSAWSSALPQLVDADGDGIRSKHVGGSDPDDGKWDTDGDGLSDFFELGWGSRADAQDSDSDGLRDDLELRYGTNPNRADSDFDGLSDSVELDGWEFIYGFDGTTPLRTWVRANPLDADPDHDDILDSDERRYGFHPLVASEEIVMSYAAALKNPALPSDVNLSTLYARGGQVLNYDARVGNELNNRHIYGQLLTQGDSAFSLNSDPQSFFLLPLENITRTTPITVQANVPSGVYRISQRARGYVDDPRSATQQAIAYWSFDNERPLIDLSGALPSTHLTCGTGQCPVLTSTGKIGSGMDYAQNVFGRLQAPGLVSKLGNLSNYSIGGWLYPQNHGLGNPLTFFAFNTVGNTNIHAVRYDIVNKKFLYVDPVVGTVTSSRTFEMNQWHYVALVINSGSSNNGTLFVDGVPEATFSTSSRPTSDMLFHIGNQIAGTLANNRWYGKIDEVKVFNRALTANEVVDAMEVVEPVMDASWDNWLPNGGSSSDKSYFDRSGRKEVVRCSGSTCPSLIETPWGTGVKAGQLLISFAGFTNLQHKRYSLALRVKPTQEPSVGSYYDFIGYLSEGSYGYPEVPAVGYDKDGALRVYFNYSNQFVTAAGAIKLNVWNQVVITFDGTTMSAYVDGQLVGATTSLAGYPVDSFGSGQMLLNSNNDFAVLDELQVFDYTLSANQIKRLFGGSAYEELHLRFEDAPGATRFANDASRGRDGFCNLAANQCPTSNVEGRNGAAIQSPNSGRVISIQATTATPPLLQATAAAWVKGSGTVLSRVNDMDLVFGTSGVQIRTVDVSSGTRVTTTRTLNIPVAQQPDPARWNHIALTFSGVGGGYYENSVYHPYAQLHLYVNGQEVAADLDGPVGSLLASSNAWQIGSGFVGSLDEVRLYRSKLISSEIQSLYLASAPSLWLKFDEFDGATSFADSAGNYNTATCTNCPKAGLKGRMGASAAFTTTSSAAGQLISVGLDSRINFHGVSPLSVSSWVKPLKENSDGTIASHVAASSGVLGNTFKFELVGGKPKVSFSGLAVQAPNTLLTNVWSQIFAVYGSGKLTLYVNGQQVGSASGAGIVPYTSSYQFIVGGGCCTSGTNSYNNFFDGSVDEVMLFQADLNATDISQIYEDQSAWVEERSRFEVTVDNDVPTTTIRSTLVYRLNQPAILDLFANDPTSPLYKVELLTNGTPQIAPLCVGADVTSAYCPTFSPNGEGRYALQSRATDVVGNVSSSAILNVLVDSTAPTATVTTNLSSMIQPIPHPSELQRWLLPLAGLATDPNLSSGDAGSGLQSLQLTIYDADGAIVGAGTQPVTVAANGTWQHEYLFFEKPNGHYRIEGIVTDKAGNTRIATLGTVIFDGHVPDITTTTILPSDVITDPITFGGVVSDTQSNVNNVEIAYVPSRIGSVHLNQSPLSGLVMHLPLDDSDGVTVTHDIAGFNHDGNCITCPRFEVSGHAGNAAVFDGVDDFVSANAVSTEVAGGAFSMGAFVYVDENATGVSAAIMAFNSATEDNFNRLHYYPIDQKFGYYDDTLGHVRSAATFAPGRWHHVIVTVDDVDQGVLYVDGTVQATFTTVVRPSADARFSVGQEWDADTPSEFFKGKLDEVQLYNRALSAEEVHQLVRGSDPLLALDFEERWMTNGMTLTDQSGWQQPAVISSNDTNNKSVVGNVGNQAMWFDGIDDVVNLPAHPSLDLSQGQFSEMVWIYPNGNNSNSHFILGYNPPNQASSQRYPSLYLNQQTELLYGFGNGSQWLNGTTGSVITPDAWNFVVATFDGTEYRIWVNGQLVHSDSSMAGQKPYPTTQLRIGSQENAFRGALDDVRIYPRALSDDEIRALYGQGWQQVQLGAPGLQSAWTTTVPTNMEGLFSIEVRATDSLGNVGSRQSLWRGVIDNMAPRITATGNMSSLVAQSQASSFAIAPAVVAVDEYTATDFNLSTENFSTKCGIGKVDQETDFESDWLLAFTDEEAGNSSRLYKASASCPQGSSLGYVNACDIYGNCTASAIPTLPKLSAQDLTVSENEGVALLTVSLNQTRTWDVSVDYSTNAGSATAIFDYDQLPTQTLTIPAGDLSGQISIGLKNDAIFEGTETFTLTIGNPTNAKIDKDTAVVTLLDDEEPPVASSQTITTNEDTPLAITLTASDANNDPLIYTLVTSPTEGELGGVVPNLIYTPALNFNGIDSFSFKANDGDVDSVTATVTINVTAVNDDPVADAQTVATYEDVPLAVTLTASDVDHDLLSYAVISSPTHGELGGVVPNLVYTPSLNFNGTDAFTFLANDGVVDSAVVTVTISISSVNDVSVASSQTITTDEDTPLAITLVANDVDGDVLTYTVVTSSTNGALGGVAPNLVYTPALHFNGTDSFAFMSSDGLMDSELMTVTIDVLAINDAPVADSQRVATAEDTSLSLMLTASDVEGDVLTYTVVTSPTNGELGGIAPNLVYTPSLDFNGADAFAFLANDGELDSTPVTVTIAITPVNDVSVASSQTITTNEDTSLSITLTAGDIDGDLLTYTLVTSPTNGVLGGIAPNLIYTPSLNFHGTDSFSFRTHDGSIDSEPVTVTMSVLPVNDDPVADAQTAVTDEDTPLAIRLTANDIDGDPLTYTLVTSPTDGELGGVAPDLIYTPSLHFNGMAPFTFLVNDGSADSAVVTVTIAITPVNDVSVALSQTVTTDEDTPLDITLTANDVDGDPLTYAVVTSPTNGELGGVAPNLVYTPALHLNGTDNFSFKSNDGIIDSEWMTVTIKVLAVNDEPVADVQTAVTDEDTPVSLTLTANDIDGDLLTYTVVTSPTKGVLSGIAPNLVYTPTQDFNGTDSFSFKVNDGKADSVTATIIIDVTAINDAPIANTQMIATDEDTPLNITLTANDVDGDPLTYTLVTSPTNGELGGVAPNLVYTPAQDFNGTDSFSFKSSDGRVDSVTATVTVDVTAINDAPVADGQMIATDEDKPLAITLTAKDIDGDLLTYTVVTSPTHGELGGIAPNLVYTPAQDFNGTDNFSFKASDGLVHSEPVTVTIAVLPVNDAPMADAQTAVTDEDTAITLILMGSDIEDDALSFTVVEAPIHGKLGGIAPNLVYTPAQDFNGTDNFSFKAGDGLVHSEPVTVTIAVLPVNDAPQVNVPLITTNEDASVAVTLIVTDVEGARVTYSVGIPPQHGTLSGIAPNFVYKPDVNFHGEDSFTLATDDGVKGAVNASSVDAITTVTVTIQVAAVNDAPLAQSQVITMTGSTPVDLTLFGMDVDDDAISYRILDSPKNGQLSGTAPDLRYTANANFSGTDVVTFVVNDGQVDSALGTVTIVVTRPTGLDEDEEPNKTQKIFLPVVTR